MRLLCAMLFIVSLSSNASEQIRTKVYAYYLGVAATAMILESVTQIVGIGYTRALSMELSGSSSNSTTEYIALFSTTSPMGNAVNVFTLLGLTYKLGKAADDGFMPHDDRRRRILEAAFAFKAAMSLGLQTTATYLTLNLFANPPDEPASPSLRPSVVTSMISMILGGFAVVGGVALVVLSCSKPAPYQPVNLV